MSLKKSMCFFWGKCKLRRMKKRNWSGWHRIMMHPPELKFSLLFSQEFFQHIFAQSYSSSLNNFETKQSLCSLYSCQKNKAPVIICTFQTFWQVICVFEKFSTIFLCGMKPQHSIFREKEQSVQLHISQKLANHKFIFSAFRNFFQKVYLEINFSSLCVFERKNYNLHLYHFIIFRKKNI